ncbi:hypothetical protein E2C01_010973 [Portunus trituberculatus]|uniref:Uncharacterized protein n=1 Tax=Portunus trituberculatus TaxID=210409 RepID=A0A5B7D9S5_PORTR|nr:hypothetical protein [Portunus trituberculatus]
MTAAVWLTCFSCLAVTACHKQVWPTSSFSNDVPPPLNTTSCANGNFLHVFVGGAQLGRHVHRDIRVCSSAMATSNISCKDCEFDYWEIIAPAMQTAAEQMSSVVRNGLHIPPRYVGSASLVRTYQGIYKNP